MSILYICVYPGDETIVLTWDHANLQ